MDLFVITDAMLMQANEETGKSGAYLKMRVEVNKYGRPQHYNVIAFGPAYESMKNKYGGVQIGASYDIRGELSSFERDGKDPITNLNAQFIQKRGGVTHAGNYAPQSQGGYRTPMQAQASAGGYAPRGQFQPQGQPNMAPQAGFPPQGQPDMTGIPAGGYAPHGQFPPHGQQNMAGTPAGGYAPQGQPFPPQSQQNMAGTPTGGYAPQGQPFPPQGQQNMGGAPAGNSVSQGSVPGATNEAPENNGVYFPQFGSVTEPQAADQTPQPQGGFKPAGYKPGGINPIPTPGN